ncbi:ATP synthase F1 subunit gamma [Tissierella sp. Yu-01]|uniref:ATP synthase F1 subunit gamma n=1 Tax=Tissierella sp. Yu-01 TaxID=3035694 RepID=UPI00240DD272|nr:ATP synthase F1 subunit gamma [Tissierella sp. Yu-01]WFA08153.1 ATP synthase F1 subunit gamma [Tissierella sp. Yu-01]
MAQSTRDIKRRIKSISSIMQITNAMELVSSAKLIKARERLIKTRPYYHTVLKNMHQTFNIVGDHHPLLKEREINRSLYIIISDDRGLAGGYNNNIVRLVEDETKGREKEVSLILIGTKSIEHFRGKEYKIRKKFTGITEEPLYSDAEEIGELALNLYKNYAVDEIKIAFTRFINTMTHEPEIRQLLPHVNFWEVEDRNNNVIDFEPSPEEVLDYLIPKYLNSCIYGALIEASCSEQASRKVAMEVASENARELIDELKISYNRARQSAITTELNEIVTSAEVLKD